MYIKHLVVSAAVIGLCAMVAAPAAADAVVMIVKAGGFNVSKDRQTIDRVNVNVDDGASEVFGLEGEWRQKTGIALGIEYVQYENDVTGTGTSARSAMNTTAILVNGKKYFRPTEAMSPYLGAGIGAAVIDFSGNLITGSAGGLAVQIVGGFEFRWDKVGLYTEFKYLYAEAQDDFNQTAKATGAGVFAGISYSFQ